MIVAINRAECLALAEDGEVYPVTTWLDHKGDECDEPDAVCAIAGSGGVWFTLELSDFGASETQ